MARFKRAISCNRKIVIPAAEPGSIERRQRSKYRSWRLDPGSGVTISFAPKDGPLKAGHDESHSMA
jgi:hypothetical protein